MIDIRTALRDQGGLAGLIAKSNFLYNALTNDPDYWCSSIQDFRDNEGSIMEGAIFELPITQYIPLEGKEFAIKDQTGELAVRLYVDGIQLGCKVESLIQRVFLDNVLREMINGLNPKDDMHQVSLQKSAGGIYVLDFEIPKPLASNKSEKEYLALRFPQLAQSF